MLNIGDIQVGVDIATAASIVGAIIGFNISNWKTRRQNHNDFLIRELRKGIDDFSSLRHEAFKYKNIYFEKSIEFNKIKEKEENKINPSNALMTKSAIDLVSEYNRLKSELIYKKEIIIDVLDIVVKFMSKNDSDEVGKIISKIEKSYTGLLGETAAIDGTRRIAELENSLNEMKHFLLEVLGRSIRC